MELVEQSNQGSSMRFIREARMTLCAFLTISFVLSFAMSFTASATARNGYEYRIEYDKRGGVVMSQTAIQIGRASKSWTGKVWYCSDDIWYDNGLQTVLRGLDVTYSHYNGECTTLYATGDLLEYIKKFDVPGLKTATLGSKRDRPILCTIKDRAFENSSKTLTTLFLTEAICSIGDYAFCNMTQGYIFADTYSSSDPYGKPLDKAPTLQETAFNDIAYENVVVVVPDNEALREFRNTNWKRFKHLITSEDLDVVFSFPKWEYTVNVGEKCELAFNEKVNKYKLTWASSDEEIATVSDGVVEGHNPGYATITATYVNGHAAQCKVHVIKPVPVTDLKITVPNADINNGVIEVLLDTRQKLTVEYFPENATDKSVEWATSDANIAYVADDVLYGKNYGNVTITATAVSGVSRSIKVRVKPIEATEIKIEGDYVMHVGETERPIVAFIPENTTFKHLIWKSSDEEVAIVNEAGEIHAVGIGSAQITAQTSNGVNDCCRVDVIPTPVKSISFNQGSYTIHENEALLLSYTILPISATDKTVEFKSSDSDIVIVDSEGYVYGINLGEATIEATTKNGKTAHCKVIVEPTKATGLSVFPSESDLYVGAKIQLQTVIEPDDTTDKSITWKSEDSQIASVSECGLVTAVGPGTTHIIASTNDGSCLSAYCSVNVAPILVEAIVISPQELLGTLGDQFQLRASVLPEDATNRILEWKSSEENIATVTQEGLISLLKEGCAIITVAATDKSGVTAECAVMVSSDGGIETVLADKSAYVKIYDLQGRKVYEGVYSQAQLSAGTYIVVCNGKSVKTFAK